MLLWPIVLWPMKEHSVTKDPHGDTNWAPPSSENIPGAAAAEGASGAPATVESGAGATAADDAFGASTAEGLLFAIRMERAHGMMPAGPGWGVRCVGSKRIHATETRAGARTLPIRPQRAAAE